MQSLLAGRVRCSGWVGVCAVLGLALLDGHIRGVLDRDLFEHRLDGRSVERFGLVEEVDLVPIDAARPRDVIVVRLPTIPKADVGPPLGRKDRAGVLLPLPALVNPRQ